MMKPLEQWICDRCRELIEKPDDGWVHWRMENYHRAHSMEILHHTKASPKGGRYGCYPPEMQMDLPMIHMIGTRGIVNMLSLVDPGRYHDPRGDSPESADMRNWAEVFRRLQVPYYEEARLHFDEAKASGMLDGINEVALYDEQLLKQIAMRNFE